MWGIIPAAGAGSRIQPLAFSKELLPVGSRLDGATERPRAVSEYLVERLVRGGATKICFVIAPGKSDILEYFGGGAIDSAQMTFVVQPKPAGLCDAIFRALPLINDDETVAVGLPDTIWFPEDALCSLGDETLEFLLFPVQCPELFDAVVTEDFGRVVEIQVKQPGATSDWIWGAFKMPGFILRELHALWEERRRSDEYIGTLVNAWIARGGVAKGVKRGEAYVDVGTVHGYREAMQLLSGSNGFAVPMIENLTRSPQPLGGTGVPPVTLGVPPSGARDGELRTEDVELTRAPAPAGKMPGRDRQDACSTQQELPVRLNV